MLYTREREKSEEESQKPAASTDTTPTEAATADPPAAKPMKATSAADENEDKREMAQDPLEGLDDTAKLCFQVSQEIKWKITWTS